MTTPKAFLAIWNGIEPGSGREFELWHSHLHFAQKRDSGILVSGSRYIAEDGSYFTLYESTSPETFGPAGYTTPSPTLDADIAIRQKFKDFVRGVFVSRAEAGNGTAGALATVPLSLKRTEDEAVLTQLVTKLAGEQGIVHVGLNAYDEVTTTSFTLRLKPLPELPKEPLLLLIRAVDESSLSAAIARLREQLSGHDVEATVGTPKFFTLQHEFRS